MQAYQADIAKFDAANTKVFGISMDAISVAKGICRIYQGDFGSDAL